MNKLRMFGLIASILYVFSILAAFVYGWRIGVIVLLVQLSVSIRIYIRSKLGMFESPKQMELFLQQEKANRLQSYHRTPGHPCQMCGQKFKAHKVVKDEVICPT